MGNDYAVLYMELKEIEMKNEIVEKLLKEKIQSIIYRNGHKATAYVPICMDKKAIDYHFMNGATIFITDDEQKINCR